MSKEKIYKAAVIVLSVLLAITASLLVVQLVRRAKISSDNSSVKNNSIGPVEENWVFSAEGLLPGDEESKEYSIEFHLESEATVVFKTEIASDEKGLAEVLDIKVENTQTGKTVCGGVLSEVSGKEYAEKFSPTGGTEKVVTYKITITFDTSAGNEYANAAASVNFKWTLGGGDAQ